MNYRRIITIVATRCQILRLKCTKLFDFGLGSAPAPTGGVYSLLTAYSLLLRGRIGRGRERGGKRGLEWNGLRKGREEKEEDGNNMLPHLKQAVAAYERNNSSVMQTRTGRQR